MWYAKILYPKKPGGIVKQKKALRQRKHENHLEQSFVVSRVTRERGSGLYPGKGGVERFQDLHVILSSWKVSCLFAYFLQALPKFNRGDDHNLPMITFLVSFKLLLNFALPNFETIPRKKSLGNLGRGQRKGKQNGKPWKHITTKTILKTCK